MRRPKNGLYISPQRMLELLNSIPMSERSEFGDLEQQAIAARAEEAISLSDRIIKFASVKTNGDVRDGYEVSLAAQMILCLSDGSSVLYSDLRTTEQTRARDLRANGIFKYENERMSLSDEVLELIRNDPKLKKHMEAVREVLTMIDSCPLEQDHQLSMSAYWAPNGYLPDRFEEKIRKAMYDAEMRIPTVFLRFAKTTPVRLNSYSTALYDPADAFRKHLIQAIPHSKPEGSGRNLMLRFYSKQGTIVPVRMRKGYRVANCFTLEASELIEKSIDRCAKLLVECMKEASQPVKCSSQIASIDYHYQDLKRFGIQDFEGYIESAQDMIHAEVKSLNDRLTKY